MVRSRPVKSVLYQDQTLHAFALEMVRNGGNGTAALATIDPNTERTREQANAISKRMRGMKVVQNLVAAAKQRSLDAANSAIDRFGLDQDRAAHEMARLAFTEMRQVCDVFTETDPDTKERRQVLRFKDFNEIDADAHKAIAKVTRKPDGTLQIDLADKRAAIMDLARLKGWIQDKPEPVVAAVQLIIQR